MPTLPGSGGCSVAALMRSGFPSPARQSQMYTASVFARSRL